jgi:hypothetical protein
VQGEDSIEADERVWVLQRVGEGRDGRLRLVAHLEQGQGGVQAHQALFIFQRLGQRGGRLLGLRAHVPQGLGGLLPHLGAFVLQGADPVARGPAVLEAFVARQPEDDLTAERDSQGDANG